MLGLHDLLHVQLHEALGAGNGVGVGGVPVHGGAAGELEGGAGLEVEEEEAGPRVRLHVAEGAEHGVAGVVRPGDAVAFHAHEAGHPAAVRGVGALARVGGGDEEGVRAADPCALRVAQGVCAAGARGRRAGGVVLVEAGLDVLGAVGVHLVRADQERAIGGGLQPSVDAHADAPLEVGGDEAGVGARA